jgi:penicillin amidase
LRRARGSAAHVAAPIVGNKKHFTDMAMIRKRIIRGLLWVVGVVFGLVLITVAVVTGLLRASLPGLDGEFRAAGVGSSVVIERDDLGVPTITASNRLDAVHALGFLHAQDRFFQMDLIRRSGAGELAALLGPDAVDQDRYPKLRRFRLTAQKALAALPPDQRALVQAYAEGINAGVAALGARPPEYWVLRTKPARWLPEDSLLAVIAMALQLSPRPLDRQDTLLRKEIGSEAFDFFYPRGTDWDAALDGSVLPAAPMPGPERIDFRHGWEPGTEPLPPWWKESVQYERNPAEGLLAGEGMRKGVQGAKIGSNGWVVDGSVSASGSALVASDMHLGYSIPGPVYRVRLKWAEGGGDHDVIGLTLPGLPAVVTGSNRQVAWAPTAAELDVMDQIALEVDPNQPERYRVPGGWAQFEHVTDRIEARGGNPVEIKTRWTIWGPVIEKTRSGVPITLEGRPLVPKYVFNSPEAVDLRFFDLVVATNTDEALQIAAESGSPIINLMVGDRAGKVGWTIAGRLPRRVGKAGSQVVSWADGSNGWDGWLSAGEHPRLSSPEVPRLFSANHRKLGSEAYLRLANASSELGVRATQIRDALAGLTNATPEDMVAIQLDNRALLLERWRDLLLATLRHTNAPALSMTNLPEIIKFASEWNGRATPDSVGYRLVRGFRNTALEAVFEPLTVRAAKLSGERIERFMDGAERPVWALFEARPVHLLNPRFASYDDLLLTSIRDVVNQMRAANGGDLSRATWAQHVNHPLQHLLSQAVPPLSRWLDASMEGCSGGEDMPRIHTGWMGGSERLVVSPGHEEQGLFQMIAGQSGHFLSPYYRAGHEAWVRGQPGPLLPGPVRHTLRLVPAGT